MPGRDIQHDGVDDGQEREGPREAHRFLLVLDVGADRRQDEHAEDVDAAADAVQACESLPQAVRELERGHEQGAGAGDAMGNQPPPHAAVVIPHRMVRLDEEPLVVIEHVAGHDGDDGEHRVLRADHFSSSAVGPPGGFYAQISSAVRALQDIPIPPQPAQPPSPAAGLGQPGPRVGGAGGRRRETQAARPGLRELAGVATFSSSSLEPRCRGRSAGSPATG